MRRPFNSRYASDFDNFDDFVKNTVLHEANDRATEHEMKADIHEEEAQRDSTGPNDFDPLHGLACDAHLLAHNAWTHVLRHYRKDSSGDDHDTVGHSLRVHARDLTTHANALSRVAYSR
jgi:hypothetical protein